MASRPHCVVALRDDALPLMEQLAAELAGDGWRVTQCWSGREALEACDVAPVELLVTAFRLVDDRGDVVYWRMAAREERVRGHAIFLIGTDDAVYASELPGAALVQPHLVSEIRRTIAEIRPASPAEKAVR